ncbi:MAG TPA: hypothetical protein PKC97_07170 [Burkholderiaceae bacterium]|nr:hypothetical protein [Burkholderiaceae bacterium]
MTSASGASWASAKAPGSSRPAMGRSLQSDRRESMDEDLDLGEALRARE